MRRTYTTQATAIMITIALGLPSRLFQETLPHWYVTYAGDFCWAMLVFFLIGSLFPKASTLRGMGYALVFAYSIEFSQLWKPEWLQTLRSYKLIALVIGRGFLWSDLIAYTLGILLAGLIDWGWYRKRKRILLPS
ncbi:DUF2809 domain-containing protein [Algivirga pacifica]|uniref:DUF2809 domain-containing protein n=1 Tax=Algivirga pacifica TaxID=1162670 RepID=A0ABP9DL77_9BACT